MSHCPYCRGSLRLIHKNQRVKDTELRVEHIHQCQRCRRMYTTTQLYIQVCGVPLNEKEVAIKEGGL